MKARRRVIRVWSLTFLCLGLVPLSIRARTNVLTYHNDNARTGRNTTETILTPANVNSSHFGKLHSVTVDGNVYAQPLVVGNVNIPGQGTHNVVYVATENDSLYAIDADSGSVLWKVSFINPSAGITTVPSSGFCGNISPQIGITGTPVIDSATGTIYLVAKTKENGSYVQRLHAIDIATKAEKFGGPVIIQATVAGTGSGNQNGSVSFDPRINNQRAGLLLQNGRVVIGWGSHCDISPFRGWIISYDAGTLSQDAALGINPNGIGASVWMSGAGLAADANSNIYFATGNGNYDGNQEFGDSILKINGSSLGSFPLLDWFTPYNQSTMDTKDLDLGSGGVLLLPDLPSGSAHAQLLVEVGKTGTMYLIDRNNMGQYCGSTCTSDTQIVQEIPNAVPGMWGIPAYWNGNVYVGGNRDHLKAFSFNANGSGLLSTSPTSETAAPVYGGPTPSVSSNGTGSGMVWVLDNSTYNSTCCQVLHAYNATNLATELYNTSQAPNNRDVPGGAVKFTVPTIANGKVYVGSQATLSIYGLLTGAQVQFSPSTVTFNGAVAVGQSTSAQTVMLTNTGLNTLSVASIGVGGANPNDFSETNNCGTSVAAGASCTISITFHPTASGTRTASVLVSDNANGSPQAIPVTGSGTAVKLSAKSVSFPGTNVGQTSAPTTVTLTNVGNTTLSISSITLGGTNSSDFGETNNCGSSVAAGGSCTLTLTFHPTVLGTRSASVSTSDNGGGSPQTISLTGTGTSTQTQQVKLSPTSVTFFAPVAVGQTTNALKTTLTNIGGAALTISGISVKGTNPSDFTETNTCGSSVAAGASCIINITFHPTAIGTRTASVSISDNAFGSPQMVALTGHGTNVKSSGNGHGFPTTTVGQTSPPWTVTLTNVGSTALSITSISLGGTNPSDFSETNNCGSSVAPSGSCTLTMTFHPTATGTRTASVSISDNGGSSPQTISLTGTGQ